MVITHTTHTPPARPNNSGEGSLDAEEMVEVLRAVDVAVPDG